MDQEVIEENEKITIQSNNQNNWVRHEKSVFCKLLAFFITVYGFCSLLGAALPIFWKPINSEYGTLKIYFRKRIFSNLIRIILINFFINNELFSKLFPFSILQFYYKVNNENSACYINDYIAHPLFSLKIFFFVEVFLKRLYY